LTRAGLSELKGSFFIKLSNVLTDYDMTTDYVDALKNLVLKHHRSFLDSDQPVFVLCFDEEGRVVPFDRVFAASPKKPVSKTSKLEAIQPKPGLGYYAHLRQASGSTNAQRELSNWEVEGPDWKGHVQLIKPLNGTWAATGNFAKESPAGKKFLDRFIKGK
jgi:hypothetical protein